MPTAENAPEPPKSTRITIGVILPLSGPPALAEFAELLADGIEVAATEHAVSGVEVEIVLRDDRADPALAAHLTQELEAESVAGIVGFLDEEALLAAGRSRRQGTLLVSPTARNAAVSGVAVYSLEGPDPFAARELARYAAAFGYRRVAIVHSRAPESTTEANAFEDEARSLGLRVVASLTYEVGATYFEEQLTGVADALRAEEIATLGLKGGDSLDATLLDPVAVYLPVPLEDVKFLSPQVTHFGLDTLGIDVLGNSSWTHPSSLAGIDHRHTTGIVATAADALASGSGGATRFRNGYEAHFSRTLVSEVPALGYDAALILLAAINAVDGGPDRASGGFGSLRGVLGATGVFSVREGRIMRMTRIVQVQDGELIEPTGPLRMPR